MRINFRIILVFLSSYTFTNNITFDDIENIENKININFSMEKATIIKSYASEDPNLITLEFFDSKFKGLIKSKANYPIKKIESDAQKENTKIKIYLYENVKWRNPIQKIENGKVNVTLEIERKRGLKQNIRDIIVAIDAGHGGKDPGAVSKNNLLEKDLTLLMAKELYRTFENTIGYKPVLIRENDEFINLNNRYHKTRLIGADVFISIHADAFRLSSVKGVSVFVWSEESSSLTANTLSKTQKINAMKISDYDFNEDIAREKYPSIYEDKKNKSLMLGERILEQLKSDPYTKLHKKKVEHADFRVLKTVDVPSVLIESGFISNPDDANRLKGKPGRRMIARSIFVGTNKFFKEIKLKDTIMESNPVFIFYKINKGDNLSELAIRFNTEINLIIQDNKLKNNLIKENQIIKIRI